MKDLDFDELDRAVNSLITDNPLAKDSEPKNGPSPSMDPSAQSSNLPTPTAVEPVIASVSVPVAPSLAGRRSTGRFMDVVHPSSDMRSTLVMPERNSLRGSIAGPNIRPNPIDTKLSVPAGATPSAISQPSRSWPDPIDFNGTKPNGSETNPNMSSQPNKPEDSEDDDINRISDDITKTLSQKSSEPLESPFLSGAKVDKRPLGAFSTSVPSATDNLDKVTNSEETNGQPIGMSSQPAKTDAPLPAELQNNLLLIESDGAAHADGLAKLDIPSIIPATPDPAPAITTVDSSTMAPSTQSPVPVSALTSNGQSAAASSIAQQYTEKPNSGDQKNGAIYDTNAYHKVITRPAKKKSGWTWVLWIVILLVVGAAVGAAVYYFVLPRL